MVSSIILVSSHATYALFDSGSTYSYVSPLFAKYLNKSPIKLDVPILVATPIGESILVEFVYRACEVSVFERETELDLLILDMLDFDIILGMDWLACCHATLGCHDKTIQFNIPGESPYTFQGNKSAVLHNLIYALGACRLLRK